MSRRIPSREDIDEVAVERAVAGDLGRARLTIAERREVVRKLHARGLSDTEIGERANCAGETVRRIRARLGLRANYDGSRPRERSA